MEWIDEEEGVPVKEMVKLSKEDGTEEYAHAENLWFREIQQSLIKSQKFKEFEATARIVYRWKRVVPVKGRLQIPFNAKFLIFMPSDHYLTVIIIQDCYKTSRSEDSCMDCKTIEGQHYSIPPTAPCLNFLWKGILPTPTLEPILPNRCPLRVALRKKLLRGSTSCCKLVEVPEVFILILYQTGARTHSVEAWKDSSADEVYQSWLSDNAQTFKTVAKFLSSLFELPEVQDLLLNHKIKWRFNLELAPWWGSFFERMTRCVRRCLKKILKNAKLTYDELSTAVMEVECVLNSRPLTYVSSDDTEEPLTPSHRLTGRRVLSIPDEVATAEGDETDVELPTRRQRFFSTLLGQFWNRWKRKYTMDLREHHESTNEGANVSCHMRNCQRDGKREVKSWYVETWKDCVSASWKRRFRWRSCCWSCFEQWQEKTSEKTLTKSASESSAKLCFFFLSTVTHP